MKRFILLYIGPPLTTEDLAAPPITQAALSNWAQQAGNVIVDRGTLAAPNGSTVRDLGNVGIAPFPIYGYSVIQAEDLNQAIQIAKGHPLLSRGPNNKYEIQVMELLSGEIPASALKVPTLGFPENFAAPDEPPPGYDESKAPPLPDLSRPPSGQSPYPQSPPGPQPAANPAGTQPYGDQSGQVSYDAQSPDGELNIQHEEPQDDSSVQPPYTNQPGQVFGGPQGPQDQQQNYGQNQPGPAGPYQPQQNSGQYSQQPQQPGQQDNMPLPPSQQGPPPPLPPKQRQGSSLNRPDDPLVM